MTTNTNVLVKAVPINIPAVLHHTLQACMHTQTHYSLHLSLCNLPPTERFALIETVPGIVHVDKNQPSGNSGNETVLPENRNSSDPHATSVPPLCMYVLSCPDLYTNVTAYYVTT